MFSSKEFFQSPPYIYERDEPSQAIESLPDRMHIAATSYFREIFSRKRPPLEIIHSRRESDEALTTHILEGLEFVELMDKADRASNGLRIAVETNANDYQMPSDFGTILKAAYENPALSDHNHEHNRRTERFIESMFLNIGVLRHKISVRDWIDSSMLYAYWHDADQLLSLHRNQTEGLDIDVKKGHALAAGIMMLALHKRYAYERNVRNRRAWEVAAGAVFMTIKHDVPEEFEKAMAGRDAAYTNQDGEKKLLSGIELWKKYKNNSLDLTNIAPSQLLSLLKAEKEKGGYFIKDPRSKWGLPSVFESEYSTELAELENNHLPLLKDFDERSRSSLVYATEVVVRADLMEMIAPPYEQIYRKLQTQWSMKRPFFHISENDSLETMLHQITDGPGNIEKNDSDTRRLLWELLHIDQVSEDTPIAKSKYVKNLSKDLAVLGAFVIKDVGSRIMSGDLHDISRMYEIRKEAITKKALKKVGYSNPWRVIAYEQLKRSGEFEEGITRMLLRNGQTEYVERYLQKIHQFFEEEQRLRSIFHEKPECVAGETVHIYTQSEIQAYQTLCDGVISALAKKYNLTVKDLKKYEKNAKLGKFPVMPYQVYDSLGGTPRTFIAPLGKSTGK